MQTNTPTPPPRNRRAGRITPLPPQAPLNPAPQAPQPAPQPEPARPAPAPVQAPAQAMQPTPGAPVRPQYPRPDAARPAPYTPYASGEGLRSLHGPQQPVRPVPEQPSARWNAPAPAASNSMPAGERPRPTPPARTLYQDDPQERRTPKPVRQPPDDLPEEKPEEPRRLPGWMRTALTLLLLGVLAMGTCSLVIMADIRTAEKAREKAWGDLLSNYHVTVAADGALRVTWQDLIEHYAGVYNLDPAFVTAIIRNESSFRATAVSSVGARGLMQMMPDTAEWIAGKLNEPYDFDRLFDPETSIRYGCWYLGYLAELFNGNTVLVCAAYHAGQGEVWSWLGDTSVSPDGVNVPIAQIPIKNTRIYAERVTYAYGIYEKLLYTDPAADAVPDAHGAAADGVAAKR